QIGREVNHDLGAPSPARRLDEPTVARTPALGNGEAVHDAQFVRIAAGRCRRGAFWLDDEVEDFLLLAAEQRQDAMRRQLREGLAEVEIVAEFGTRFALAIADPRGEAATRPHQLTQRTNEIRIESALLADRVKDDRAAFLELSQIIQPLFKVTQLRVVQPTGSLLAIARDKRHRRATIEQRHGGFDLLLANAKRFCYLPGNG